MTESHGIGRRRHRRPPLWLWFLWLLPSGAIAWLWLGDPGDSGMRNAGTIIMVFFAIVLGYVWFVGMSGYSARTRKIVGVVFISAFCAAPGRLFGCWRSIGVCGRLTRAAASHRSTRGIGPRGSPRSPHH